MKSARKICLSVGVAAAILVLVIEPGDIFATPTFARKYGTSCQTCHTIYPSLNAFGEGFRHGGYRWPGGQDEDEDKIKEEPVSLGDEAYKRVWPKAVWPSDIPSSFPLAVRTQAQFVSGGEGIENDFRMPNNLWLLSAATIGDNMSYFMHAHALSEAMEGFAVARAFVKLDLARDYGRDNTMSLTVGQFEPAAVPFSTFTNLTLTNYALASYGFTMDEEWGGGHHGAALSLGRNQRGLELSGLLRGRFQYGLGLVNGNGPGFGDETYDDNEPKDFYARAAYKVGGLPLSGYLEGAEGSADWPERSFKVGVFGYWGDNSRIDSNLAVVDAEDVTTYQIIGADFAWRIKKLEIMGGLSFASHDLHDQIVRTSYEASHTVQMIQASVEALPWLIPYVRYEFVERENLENLRRTIFGTAAALRPNSKLNLEIITDKHHGNTFSISLDLAF